MVSLTCPVPAEGEPLGGGSGGQEDGEEADHETDEVCQQVGSIRGDGQTAGKHATYRHTQPQPAQITMNYYIPSRRGS